MQRGIVRGLLDRRAIGTTALISIASTAALFCYARSFDREHERMAFVEIAEIAHDQVEERLTMAVDGLRALRSLYDASVEVEPHEFAAFLRGLGLCRRLPGVYALAYAGRTESGARLELVGRGDPLGLRGAELGREAAARAALEGARDANEVAAFRLAAAPREPHAPDLALALPIYRHDAPDGAAAGQRGVHQGFAVLLLEPAVLLKDLARRPPAVDLEIYLGDPSPRTLLVDADGRPWALEPAGTRPYSISLPIALAGTRWTLAAYAPRGFDPAREGREDPYYVALLGIIIGALVTTIVAQEIRARRTAQLLAEETQRSLRLREEFLLVASHELKSPLTSLCLELAFMLKKARARGAGADEILELERAERGAQRLVRLICDMSDASRLAGGKLDLAPEDTDVAELVREVVTRNQCVLERAGCRISLDVPETLPARCDPVRVGQLIENLLTNAVKYGRGEPIDVSLSNGNGMFRLTVRDHGVGIAPEDQSRIFARFERAVSSQEYVGLGIGLSIVSEVVRLSGGTVRLESAPGQGSTFTVEIPQNLRPAPRS